MKTTKTKTTLPAIKETHDRISVDFGNGKRLSFSRSRDSASGDVPRVVFQKWSNMRTYLPEGKTIGEAVREFVANIDEIWPNWRGGSTRLAIGDRVSAEGPYGKKYVGRIISLSKRGTYYNVTLDSGETIGVQPMLLTKIEG